MTEAEYLAAIAAREDVVHVSDPLPLGKDAERTAINAARRRRVEVVRTDAKDGKLRIYYEDYGLLPDGTVVHHGAGQASEPPNPAEVFKKQAETWLTANVGTVDAKIKKWWITGVDETRRIARVMTIYDDGQGSFTEKPFVALQNADNSVEMKPLVA